MKKANKISSLLTVAALLLSLSLTLASCGEEKNNSSATSAETSDASQVTESSEAAESTETSETSEVVESSEATESTETSETEENSDYATYNKGISFSYPSDWTNAEDAMLNDPAGTGNNITITAEEKTDLYHTMDKASFDSLLGASFESLGMEITNVSIENKKNANGLDVAVIAFDNAYMGINMTQTLFCVNVEDKTFCVTLTEVVKVENLADTIFNSLK